jgi:hypothetical protein
MNRIYQAKVSKAELLDAKGHDITPKEWEWDWESALLQETENKLSD